MSVSTAVITGASEASVSSWRGRSPIAAGGW